MTYQNPVPEGKRQTAAPCGILAERLSQAIGVIRSAGIRVSDLSRLSVAVLKAVASADSLPSRELERRRLANALRDANDFEQITTLLPPSKYVDLVDDFANALKGTTDQIESQRRPYQFQTQLWLQAVFQEIDLLATPTITTPTVPLADDTLTLKDFRTGEMVEGDFGMPIDCSAAEITFTASLSEAPGARLKLSIAAGNCSS